VPNPDQVSRYEQLRGSCELKIPVQHHHHR
jgi:hypothetical protein